MSEVVGSVAIELSLDRSEYDKAIDRLRREKPELLTISPSLDTSVITRQLNAFKSVSDLRIGVDLDTRLADRRLAELTKNRTATIAIQADTTELDRKLKALSSVGDIKVKAKLDTSELTKGLAQFKTIADLNVKVNVDDRALKSVRALPNLKLKVAVDDSELTKLNKHLDLKEKHFKQVQTVFDKPLTPKIDDSGLTELNRSIDRTMDKFDRFSYGVTASIAKVSNALKNFSADSFLQISIATPNADKAISDLKRVKSEAAALNYSITNSIDLSIGHYVNTSNLESVFINASISFKKTGDEIGVTIGKNIAKQISHVKPGMMQQVAMAPLKFAMNTAGSIASIPLNMVGSLFKIPGNLLSDMVTGFSEQLGRDFLRGTGLSGKSENTAKLAKKAAQKLEEHVLGVEEMTAAFFSEVLRSGNPMKGMETAFNVSKLKGVLDQFEKTMQAADAFDPSKPGMTKAKAKANVQSFLQGAGDDQIAEIARRYVDSNLALQSIVSKVTGATPEMVISNFDKTRKNVAIKSYIDRESKAIEAREKSESEYQERTGKKRVYTKEETERFTQQKSELKALKTIYEPRNLRDFVQKNAIAMASPIVTVASQAQVPRNFVDSFLNPAMQKMSGVTDYIGKIQAHRTILEADKVKD
jgi:hypothetical protein